MCGVVGGISERNVVPVILEGLSRLEYRGYDSVGIAVVNAQGELTRERCVSRVKTLGEACDKNQFKGLIGIGHTRWATHGEVSQSNAHPHFSHNTLAIVHNGIIENYAEKKHQLQAIGYEFTSQTDTEVIIHLIHSYYKDNNNLLQAVAEAIKELRGAYAIGVMNKQQPDELICVSNGAPLILGVGIHEMYFASDVSALLPVTHKVVYLEDGDIAQLSVADYKIYDSSLNTVMREVKTSTLSANATELGQYRHFMQKEIFEQPIALADTLNYLGKSFNPEVFALDAATIFNNIERIQIIACGTSYNAGSVASYWFEEIAHLPCSVDIASEYRYRSLVANEKTLIIAISQSGETADTLAAVKHAQSLGMHNVLAICNVAESSLTRLAKLGVLTQAGIEIGVASTKAFTTQLLSLLYLAYTLAKVKGRLSATDESQALEELAKLPHLVVNALATESELKHIAKDLKYKEHALFIGRNTMYPIAVEGALKIKEISYIHAESYAAGELKHGPLSLIDKNMPVILLMPTGLLFDKVKSNAEEILARQGEVYVLTDTEDSIISKCKRVVHLATQDVATYLLPFIYIIPLQLLSYHTALAKGTDVDKPRNLAKSVTVE